MIMATKISKKLPSKNPAIESKQKNEKNQLFGKNC